MKKIGLLFVVMLIILTACGTKGKDQMNMAKGHKGHEDEAAIKSDDITAIWTFAGGDNKPQSNQDTPIRIEIRNNGKPIENFDTSHEKKLHLIVVSKDLTYFHHIHPEYKGHGEFDITTQFPTGGDYELIADFIPSGGGAMHKMEWTHVEGVPTKAATIEPEVNLTKTIDGKSVTLTFDKLEANKQLMLTYTIKDATRKIPITNLQPYLGAVGHVVILTEDAKLYLHVHPMEDKASGPDAKFMTTFPKSGVYKIWGQFKHNDKVFTVPFVVKVP